MGFIGVQPATVPLTSSDITDGIISTAKISDDAVDNTKLDLTDNYAFTGTISGASDMVLLANINNSSVGASTFEWSMDYDDYNNFIIVVNRLQGSSSTNSSLQIEFKFNGSYGGGETNPYYIEGEAGSDGGGRNYNSAGNGELFFTNAPNKYWAGILRCVNFRGSGLGIPTLISELSGTTLANNNHGSFYMLTGLHTVNVQQITDLRINFSNGNVSHVNFDIYGLRRT
tara:strand:- start:219 stop:902 length:684 start_codon:yes stop_codon:yes gene_type:complete